MGRLSKLAFTLAEVLIVISIIGVVAEMTIPTLVSKSDKQVETTQFKKFYSEFGQGMKSYMISQGCNDLECTGIFAGARGDTAWESNMDAAMKSAFKIVKSCPTYSSECDKPLWNLDKSSATASFYYGRSFVTADGFMFMVYDTDAGNCTNWGSPDPAVKVKGACATIYVDINGTKKPDTWGRDIFLVILGNDGTLYPWGGSEIEKIGGPTINWKNNALMCGTAGSTAIGAGTTGSGCAARIMDEAWAMKY